MLPFLARSFHQSCQGFIVTDNEGAQRRSI